MFLKSFSKEHAMTTRSSCNALPYLPVIAFSLLAGCTNHTTSFSDKPHHLLGSRAVGHQEQRFESAPYAYYDFNSPQDMQHFQIVNGDWELHDGTLVAVGGDQNRSILLAPCRKGPLRIELEVTNTANPNGSIGDITLLVNSENSSDFFDRGYALTTGSYYNNCSTFYKHSSPIAKTEYSPLVSGKTYRVALEINNGHIRYWLDDEIILESWDPHPIQLDPNLWIGLRTWNTHMSVNWFAVYQGQQETKQNAPWPDS